MELSIDFLIVEDEFLIAETIKAILVNAGYQTIRMVSSYEEAVEEIKVKKPTLVLTDIALGKQKTGVDLGVLLNTKYCIPFIYITSHTSVEIINQVKHTRPNAYIVKPFKAEDLLVAIELALFNSNTKPQNADNTDEELVVKEGRSFIKLLYSEILWFEVEGNYTTIHLINGKRRVVRVTIAELERQMKSATFIRTHKSYLINKNHIQEIRSNTVLLGENELPVGRTYQTTVNSLKQI